MTRVWEPGWARPTEEARPRDEGRLTRQRLALDIWCRSDVQGQRRVLAFRTLPFDFAQGRELVERRFFLQTSRRLSEKRKSALPGLCRLTQAVREIELTLSISRSASSFVV